MNVQNEDHKCATGIPGFDIILNGGLPCKRLYLIQGEPGTGKTTLSLQFLMEGIKKNERVLYITFSETRSELEGVARSHNWDISKLDLLELSAIEDQLRAESQNTIFHPAEVEMNQTIDLVKKEFERVKPSRLVFDSVSEMRLLSDTSLRYRRQMLEFKQYFTGKNCTVLFLDDLTSSPNDLQLQSIVHGVVNLQKLHPEFGEERRRINIVKLRGVQFSGGYHDYKIIKGGVAIYPRIIASDHPSQFKPAHVSSGLVPLDKLLGGGLEIGTSNLFLGPAGTGKSTLAIQFAYQAARRGEKAGVFAFEESLHTLYTRTLSMGIDLKPCVESGNLEIQKIDPAQLSPGEFADMIRKKVLESNMKIVVIDSLNGYMHAMPQEEFLTLQLHELLSFLSNQGVVTIMVLAQQGMMGPLMSTPVDVTYLADSVIVTRYFEAMGSVKKAVSVLKKRSGEHESTIREFSIGSQGIVVGNPLVDFQGVLTGTPKYLGQGSSILEKQRIYND